MNFNGKSIMPKKSICHFSLSFSTQQYVQPKANRLNRVVERCFAKASVMVSRRAKVEFGQCCQEKFCDYYGDPCASLHKLITTRDRENLLGSSVQMSKCKVGIFVFFWSIGHRSVSKLVLQLDVVHVIYCLFMECVCMCVCEWDSQLV